MNESNVTAAGLPVEPLDFAFRPKRNRKQVQPDSDAPATPGADTPQQSPTRPAAAVEKPPAAEAPAQGTGAAEVSRARKRRAPGRPLGGGRQIAADESTQLVAYLPEELAEKLRQAAARRRQPRGDVIIAAAVALAGEAADLVSAHEPGPDPELAAAAAAAGFTVPAAKVQVRRVPVNFQTTGANRDALQALTIRSGATDRTHLLTVLLEAFLDRESAS